MSFRDLPDWVRILWHLDKEAYNHVIKYYNRRYAPQNREWPRDVDSFFTWSEQPQGLNYWQRMHLDTCVWLRMKNPIPNMNEIEGE